ncbi:ATP-dependent sacrificial sulfur transferase LarE [Vallitalea okinawensis]|uniref:ATP-dependent sacrificial sulfur transferase LarE n=1 Tax=Vallitalea okinawensis TaxID=2078660 RepID=UPI000CFA9925|nr:ATP-dependent sacrificial sulfur transferase LarE [Vallitalea okinawensis]
MNKYSQLIDHLQELGSVLVAFSGGVDSTFLLRAAKDALGDQVKAVTVKSPYIPGWELEESKNMSEIMGVTHDFIEVGIMDAIKDNPKERCYLCKTYIFTKIKEKAMKEGYNYVIDGSNFDDTKDYRPGMKALQELGIRSPLLECKWTKNDIRSMSQSLGLPTWNKPAYACLLTRLPFGTKLEIEAIKMIEEAEKVLFSYDFKAVRVRKHGDLARIEVDSNRMSQLFDQELMKKISQDIKATGFKYVTLDMEGYKMGSFNGEQHL